MVRGQEVILDADKLDALAKFLDGFDDGLAAEARQMARNVRKGLLISVSFGTKVPDVENHNTH